MGKSDSIEILFGLCAMLSGAIIWNGRWMILLGILFYLVTSYFLVSLLKKATINEFLKELEGIKEQEKKL